MPASTFLSIIIPTFNRYSLVIQSIDSAIEFIKNFGGSSEIVVVDDCSSDKTFDRLNSRYEEYIRQKEIRLMLSHRNLGVTSSRNTGISAANGTWLMFLDADDRLIPQIPGRDPDEPCQSGV